MTFKVTILGSSAALPMAGKHHSAHALNVHEQFYLIDCGEGTQTRLGECGISPVKINAIFITHLHGDHLYGLFPLISTMSLMGRKIPLKVFGPRPLGELMERMNSLSGDGPQMEVEYFPVDTTAHEMIYENSVMEVWSLPLRHRVPTAGYLFREKTPPRNVHKDMIARYGLSLAQIVEAKRGGDITTDDGNRERANKAYGTLETGVTLRNDLITYIPYLPRSYAYCSDTLYSGKAAKLVCGADLLYHEATFADRDKALARQTGHSTTAQAARAARTAEVDRLLIGHFSGRYKEPDELLAEARTIFPETYLAEEGATFSIETRKP